VAAQAQVGAGRLLVDGEDGGLQAVITPVFQLRAGDKDVRRVDRLTVVLAHQPVLPVGELLLAEAVFPADIVPVGHVQGDGHGRAGVGRQLAEHGVGRRAAGAALGGVKLDQRGGLGPAADGADGFGKAGQQRDKQDKGGKPGAEHGGTVLGREGALLSVGVMGLLQRGG